ncbi:MAG: lysylphosphatidylglycerol synthase transmembrane domain-containing protein, partial [Gaiellaceae bacterium]
MRHSRLLRAALVVAAAAGVAALLVFRGPNWGQVGHALVSMVWWWALAAVGFNVASTLVRGLAWRTVLVEAVPPPHPGLLDVASAFFIGIFANGVLPGRVGEVARVGVLVRRMPSREGVWPPLLGSVLAHRLLEIFPSLGLIVWVLVAAKIPGWGRTALWSVAAVGLVLFLAGVVLARRHEHELPGGGRLLTLLRRTREGLGVLRRPRAAVQAAGLQ